MVFGAFQPSFRGWQTTGFWSKSILICATGWQECEFRTMKFYCSIRPPVAV